MTQYLGNSYVNQIWSQAFSTLVWYNSQIFSTINSPTSAELVQETLTSAAGAIETASFVNAIQQQVSDLTNVLGLPINLGPASACVVNRLNSLNILIGGLDSLLPSPPFQSASGLLSVGQLAIPTSDYIAYYSSYSGEISPDYTIVGILENSAQWISVVGALQTFYGNSPNTLFDTVSLISSAAQMISQTIFGFASGLSSGSLNMQYLYNQSYSLPATFIAANVISQNMGLLPAQQSLVACYALRTIASQIQNTLMIASTPQTLNPVNSTVVFGSETLQDVAARTLGNFEGWEAIAALNNIIPGTNLTAGQTLFLPSLTQSGIIQTSYAVNVLGRDVNLGPTNTQMPPWTGDFQTIQGTNNLIYALGRRLQTTLGTMVFHTDYGSRIPPEVGAIQTLQTAGQTAAFGKSCLLTDPRVSQVSQNTVTSGLGYGEINYTATVVPIGPGQVPVEVNAVIRA